MDKHANEWPPVRLRRLSGADDPTHRTTGDKAGERLDPERRDADRAYIRAWHRRRIAKKKSSE